MQRRELARAGARLAQETGLDYVEAKGKEMRGAYRRSIALASGRFAVIVHSPEFTLVPWRGARAGPRAQHQRNPRRPRPRAMNHAMRTIQFDPKARVLVNSHAIYADCGPSGLMLGHAGFRLMPLQLAPAYAG